ncbi:MAG TPA: XdhC family protein, partial [Gemmataceae bacterium]|nr:XdhC family protein [Gemmataceae bacterium]
MRELLAELTTALSRRLPCVYCAVVETRGSTPQKAGAAMLVYPDGTQAGTLGGGCVEAEVKRRALHGLNDSGRPEVLTFNLDDDYGWDDGLICGGRMTILAHPLAAHGALIERAVGYYQLLRDLADRGDGFTEAVVIGESAGLPLGDRYLFDAKGAPAADLAGATAWDKVSAHL